MQIEIPKVQFHRAAIVGAGAAAIVLALSGGLRFVMPSQARPGDDIRTEGPKQAANTVIAQALGNCSNYGTFNGTMNNNCNNTTINQAPAPAVQTVEKTEKENPDGSYSQNFHIRVVSPYSAKQLIVGAKAPNLLNVHLTPDGGGVMMNVREGSCGDQCLGVQIGAPVVGDYWVYVVTKQKEDVSLLWNVQ